MPIGQALQRAFLQQLDSLSPETRAALVIAAASEFGEIGEIRAACRRVGVEPGSLDAAEISGLVELEAGALRFRHPLLRTAVYQAASAPQRRSAHAALAEAQDGERRAWHLAAATESPDESVAATLDEAARAAQLRGGIGEAARAFERAAHLSEARERRAGRLVAAAGGYLLSGELDRAFELLGDALATTGDERLRAEIHHLRARGRMVAGSPMEAYYTLVAEAARTEPVDLDRAALMLVDAAFACFTTVRLHLGRETAERAYQLAERGSGAARLAATVRFADTLVFTGAEDKARPLLEWSRAQLEQSHALAFPDLIGTPAYTWIVIEEHAAARDLLERQIAAARAASAPGALPLALALLAELEFRTGQWTQAAAHAFEAARLARETGQAIVVGYAVCQRARMDAAYGREQEFERDIRYALSVMEQFDTPSLLFLIASGRALLSLPVGESAKVIRELERLRRLVAEAGEVDPGISLWQADLVEALVYAGRPGDAEAELGKLEGTTGTTRRPTIRAVGARCRGLLAGDQEFEDEFASALRWHERTSAPFERARSELALGVRRRRVGRRLQARESLRAALETFERLGARRWADLAGAELRATGEGIRPRHQTIAEELTAQELQVALAVGSGATNREAAEALFLSPKTIEYHLGHVYRKLGVRSRSELARLLAREEASSGIAGLRAATSTASNESRAT